MFMYKKATASKFGAVMCAGVIAVGLFVSIFVLDMASQGLAACKAKETKTSSLLAKEMPEFNINAEMADVQKTKKLLAQALVEDDESLETTEAISFQATMFSESTSVGRSEPFAPSYGYGSSMGVGTSTSAIGPMDDPAGSGMTPEEIAKMEAEKRRQEIMSAIRNDFTVKGIVLDVGEEENPMVIAEVIDSSGSPTVKTFSQGEAVRLAVCEALIKKVYANRVLVVSEDVEMERYLPDFEDEGDDFAGSGDLSGDFSDMGAPPTPTQGSGSSSISDAKQKIEEIDKLLDSF